jgi:hypothetical protein
MPNGRVAAVFWRAPVYQRVPSPRQGFSIGASAPTLRVLDRDKSPLVSRADAPKKGGPPRCCTGETGMTPITHLYTVRACALIVRRPVKTKASRLRRALTGRHGHGYDAAHRARHHQKEEPL